MQAAVTNTQLYKPEEFESLLDTSFATKNATTQFSFMRCSTVVDGAVNGDVFEAFVKQVLLPELRPGDIVIIDNLSSHKRACVGQLITQRKAELCYLPPYSPDLNPIELIFSKVKQALRSLAARITDALWEAASDPRQHHPPATRSIATATRATRYMLIKNTLVLNFASAPRASDQSAAINRLPSGNGKEVQSDAKAG